MTFSENIQSSESSLDETRKFISEDLYDYCCVLADDCCENAVSTTILLEAIAEVYLKVFLDIGDFDLNERFYAVEAAKSFIVSYINKRVSKNISSFFTQEHALSLKELLTNKSRQLAKEEENECARTQERARWPKTR